LKVPRREKISYEECKRRVTLDFEEEMGITDVLDDDPDEDMLQLVADARRALEPHIEKVAQQLFIIMNH